MTKYSVYVVECTKDYREMLRPLIAKDKLECHLSFDKWNNALLIEVENDN